MADDTNQPLFGGMPSVSPSSLALRRAAALKMIESGNEYSPLLSKWQGAARIANAVMGNIQAGMADRSESQARKQASDALLQALAGRMSPQQAKIMELSATNPFVDPRIALLLGEKQYPEREEAPTYSTYRDPTTGRVVPGTGVERPVLGTQSVSPEGSVSQPTAVQPPPPPGGLAPGGMQPAIPMPRPAPPRQAPPMSETNTATAPVQIGAGFNAMGATGDPQVTGQTSPGYRGQMSIDQLFKWGQEHKDINQRNQMALDERKQDFQRGINAQQRRQVYQTLNDAYQAGGDAISGGPAGSKILEAKQLLNQFLGFNPEGLQETEVIKKTSGKLAQEAAAGLRGTNLEFNAALSRSPGYEMSNTGSRYMLHILNQENNRDEKFGIEGQQVAPEQYAQFKKDWFGRNPIMSPFTGKPLQGETLESDMSKLRDATKRQTPQQPPAGGWGTVRVVPSQ